MQNNINQTNNSKCQDKNKNYSDIYNQIIDSYSQDTVIDIEIQHKCDICLEDFDERQISILEKCEHIFHKKCLENNVRKFFPHDFQCPTCKKAKIPKNVRSEETPEPGPQYYPVLIVKIITFCLFLAIMASIFMKINSKK